MKYICKAFPCGGHRRKGALARGLPGVGGKKGGEKSQKKYNKTDRPTPTKKTGEEVAQTTINIVRFGENNGQKIYHWFQAGVRENAPPPRASVLISTYPPQRPTVQARPSHSAENCGLGANAIRKKEGGRKKHDADGCTFCENANAHNPS